MSTLRVSSLPRLRQQKLALDSIHGAGERRIRVGEGGGDPALDRRSPRINQIRERFVFVTPTWAPRRDACVSGVTKPS